MKKESLREFIANTETEEIRIGSTIEIYIGRNLEDQKQRAINKGLAKGFTVIRGGVSRWHHWEAIVDLSKEASAQYQWDASGERVKGDLIEYTKTGDIVKKEVIKTTYRKYE